MRHVGSMAFACASIGRPLIIPASVEEIGEQCFRETKLSSVAFESGSCLKKIGKEAFAENKYLKSKITIPASVEVIGEECFKDCVQFPGVEYEPGSRLIRDNALPDARMN